MELFIFFNSQKGTYLTNSLEVNWNDSYVLLSKLYKSIQLQYFHKKITLFQKNLYPFKKIELIFYYELSIICR